MSKLFRVFPNDAIPPLVSHAEGLYIYTKDGRKLLDMSAGSTSYAILGWSHQTVLSTMQEQMKRFCHMDYKAWSDENTERLADLLLSRAEHGLNKVYFAGNSGAEACEAAMKMSYQTHYDLGKMKKTWFISRNQSYHGSTTDAMAISERPNLAFYKPLLPRNRAKVSQHHPLYMMKEDETLDVYAKRSAKEIEDMIIKVGPENVCAFIGETMMGGLVGDVPPAPNYWKEIRKVCDRYDVHLILDEVYCGTGCSGKIYCCDWDGVTPDFIFMGKTLAAGYAPISVVVTSDKIEQIIKEYQGRLQHTTTHQAYSLGVAAALAVQKIIHTDEMLFHIRELGSFMRESLKNQLSSHPFFREVRGRGLRFSLEYTCENKHKFGTMLAEIMERKYDILISGKWHRVSFTPAFLITREEAEMVLDRFIVAFKNLAATWKNRS